MVNIPGVQQLKCDYQLGADAYLVQEKKTSQWNNGWPETLHNADNAEASQSDNET